MKKTDILIVGQGIAGTVLAYLAVRKGLKVTVIDSPMEGRATEVAGGLFNPVTGRRIKKSWNYELFYEQMRKTYRDMDEFLGIQTYFELPVYRLLPTIEDVNNWEIQRLEDEYIDFMKEIVSVSDKRVRPHQGAGKVVKGGYVDLPKLLSFFRKYLKNNEALREEVLDYNLLYEDKYKDISFKNIIFCEGFRVESNPFFPDIHLWATKGETLLIEIEGEDLEYILNKHIFLIPIGNGLYKVGSTMERSLDVSVSQKGLSELKEKLDSILSVPYKVLKQEAGIRPNVRDRKPLIGVSKGKDNYYVFNGLGSKGVSLAPYFANHLLEHIYEGKPLQKDVNWQRIYRKPIKKLY